MRSMNLFCAFLLVAGAAAGCTSKAGSSAAEPGTSEAAASRVIKETKEAAQAVRAYTFAQRAEFVAQATGELSDIQAELDRLSAKAVDASAKATLDVARERWAQAKRQLDLAESATESTWSDVQGNAKKAHEELKTSVASARQWLSDKIAP